MEERGGFNLFTILQNGVINLFDPYGLCGNDNPPILWPPKDRPYFPEKPLSSDEGWKKFLEEAGKGLWHMNKDKIKDWVKDLVPDWAKNKGENLGLGDNSKNGNKGFGLDGLGVKYNTSPETKLYLKFKVDYNPNKFPP